MRERKKDHFEPKASPCTSFLVCAVIFILTNQKYANYSKSSMSVFLFVFDIHYENTPT